MEELKSIIARNIASLRRAAGLTQIGLAEELSYSDKAVSKWERGASLPDIAVLKQIADRFGVTVDYLITEHTEELRPEPEALPEEVAAAKYRNRMVISLQANTAVWLLATVVFVILSFATDLPRLWTIYIYALPFSCIVALVFNSLWGRNKKLNYLYISALLWGLLLCIYILFWERQVALIFCIGVPAQIIILFCTRIKGTKAILQDRFAAGRDRQKKE